MKQDARTKCLSAFQRLRVLEESTNGYGKCITCGKILPISELDGGHYIGRRHRATELEPDNVHPQCRHCNRFLNGDAVVYRQKLIEKIGENRVKHLEDLLSASLGSEEAYSRLSENEKRACINKRNSAVYDQLAKYYRAEYRKLLKEKS